ncbi:protein ZNF365 [Camelus dromedarius]|uniref:LOW QUALITY PROTEIN: protein ZNF365 n=3 Tax=Camelus TaxID=9836 RepID=A0A8B8TYI2_CAMFR|nr:protein ZNF365 isoform X1 [Camelus bactrianus]XP_031317095.1 protein ZNF365 isoform X1 [Camelus dromedarius]XP_032347369.1 LOW QUALITY PROTEIN: protein ZNF365 [Camelus ferus]
MQQKAFEESRYPWQESFENVAVCLPFRCPRCGDHTRFRSLSSLRAHLEFSHSYRERTLLTKCSLFPSLRDTDLVTSSEPLKQGKLQSCGNIVKQKPSYVNLYSISHEHSKDRKPFEVVAERPVSYVQTYTTVDLRADSLDGPRSSPGLPTSETKTAFEAHVREKFNRMVEAVDRTIEKRIDKLTRELAQKTAELLEVRAAFVQLTQKKQEVQRREQALNRQVDVAVEMIAVLRQRLTESEEELLRKEEEVVTFNHFLEAAAEKEVQGKARLQDFIENLLHRVELAEKQLEYYHSQQAAGLRRDATEHVLTDVSSNRKPKCLSRGHPHSVCNHPDLKTHFHPKGRSYLKKAKDDRASMQPAKSMHEQAESPREFCRPAKKGEPLGFSRKGNIRPKMAKKKPTAIVNII